MLSSSDITRPTESLSLRRAWIEMARPSGAGRWRSCRSPYGERGLKCDAAKIAAEIHVSLSLRRAWIEIIDAPAAVLPSQVALLTESVD